MHHCIELHQPYKLNMLKGQQLPLSRPLEPLTASLLGLLQLGAMYLFLYGGPQADYPPLLPTLWLDLLFQYPSVIPERTRGGQGRGRWAEDT